MTSSKLNINLFFEAYAAALTANAQKKYPGAVVTVKSIKPRKSERKAAG